MEKIEIQMMFNCGVELNGKGGGGRWRRVGILNLGRGKNVIAYHLLVIIGF